MRPFASLVYKWSLAMAEVAKLLRSFLNLLNSFMHIFAFLLFQTSEIEAWYSFRDRNVVVFI